MFKFSVGEEADNACNDVKKQGNCQYDIETVFVINSRLICVEEIFLLNLHSQESDDE